MQIQLDEMLNKIEKYIKDSKKLTLEIFAELKTLVKKLPLRKKSMLKYGKDKSIQSDSIKGKKKN